MQKLWLRCLMSMAAIALVVSAAPKAHADSVTYDLTGSFANGASLSGWADWSSVTGTTAYSLSLSNSTDSAVCNSSSADGCYGVLDLFATTKGPELLAGILDPFGSLLTLTGPGWQFSATGVSWVAVPEGSEGIQIILALLVLGFAMYRYPRLKLQMRA